MFSTDRILVPFDASDVSRRALSMAIQLASAHKAELYLLYVHKDLDDDLHKRMETAPDEHEVENAILADEAGMRAAVRDELAQVEDAGLTLHEFEVQTIVTGGEWVPVGLQVIDDNEIDLVVVGTHGASTLAERVVGSGAERLARQAPCSVFVVKPEGYPYLRD